MSDQTEPDFYLQVEDFILNSAINGCDSNNPQDNEVRLFLMTLVYQHKIRDME